MQERAVQTSVVDNKVVSTMYRRGLTCAVVQEQGMPPHSSEVWSEQDNDVYADIGLVFEGNRLIDYDGVGSLPGILIECLEALGYDVLDKAGSSLMDVVELDGSK